MPPYNPLIVRAAISDPANAGLTSAQLAASPALAPSPVYSPINLAQLDAYLLTHSLKTPLVQLAAAPGTDPTLAAGLTDFLALLDSLRHTQLAYDDLAVRGRTNLILGVLMQMQKLTADQVAAIQAMGTSQSYPASAEVTEAIVDFEKLQMAVDAVQARFQGRVANCNAMIDAARRSGVIPTDGDLAAIVGAA